MSETASSVQMHTSQPAEPVLPTGSVLTQVSSALGGVLLLIVLAGWLFRRLGFTPQKRRGAPLNLHASCQVGPRERVVVVEVDNTWLVLGVTAQQITPLHTLSAPPASPDAASAAPSADFRQLIRNVLQRPEKSA